MVLQATWMQWGAVCPSDAVDAIADSHTRLLRHVCCLLGAGETGGCHQSGVSGGGRLGGGWRAAGSLSVLDRSRASGMWPRRISPVGPRMSSWPWPLQSARPRRRFVRLLGRCRRTVVYPRARRPDQAPTAAISFLYPPRWPSHPDE